MYMRQKKLEKYLALDELGKLDEALKILKQSRVPGTKIVRLILGIVRRFFLRNNKTNKYSVVINEADDEIYAEIASDTDYIVAVIGDPYDLDTEIEDTEENTYNIYAVPGYGKPPVTPKTRKRDGEVDRVVYRVPRPAIPLKKLPRSTYDVPRSTPVIAEGKKVGDKQEDLAKSTVVTAEGEKIGDGKGIDDTQRSKPVTLMLSICEPTEKPPKPLVPQKPLYLSLLTKNLQQSFSSEISFSSEMNSVPSKRKKPPVPPKPRVLKKGVTSHEIVGVTVQPPEAQVRSI